MKSKLILLSAAGFSLLLNACSTSNQVAGLNKSDDVYFSMAVAEEREERAPEPTYSADRDDRLAADDSYLQGYYDGSYASRLNRFYGNNWRSSYYGSPYSSRYMYYGGYNYGPSFNLNIGLGSRFNTWDPFYSGWGYNAYNYGNWGSPMGYFYSPYYYGGLYGSGYAYNSSFPGYGYGGYYSPGNSDRYPSRTRPNREGGDRSNGLYGQGSATANPSVGRPQRSGTTSSGDRSGRTTAAPASGQTTSRPAARPDRSSSAPSSSNQNSGSSRPERSSQPSSQPSNSGSQPSSGSSSSGSRPTRGGE